jgi:hypothetical protein
MPRLAVHMIMVVTNKNRDDETVDVLFEQIVETAP